MSFRVLTTSREEADVEEIHEWIAEHDGRPSEASRWLDGFEDALASLEELPLRCSRAAEAAYVGADVRQLKFHSHRILFVVDEADVVVLHVRHGSRLPARREELD